MTPEPTTTPLEIDLLLSADERRTCSIEKQIEFQESISTPSRCFDEVDKLVEEIRAAEYEGKGARP